MASSAGNVDPQEQEYLKMLTLFQVKQNGYALGSASSELKNDKQVVLEAVKQNGDALRYASVELKGDKEVGIHELFPLRSASRTLEKFIPQHISKQFETFISPVVCFHVSWKPCPPQKL